MSGQTRCRFKNKGETNKNNTLNSALLISRGFENNKVIFITKYWVNIRNTFTWPVTTILDSSHPLYPNVQKL